MEQKVSPKVDWCPRCGTRHAKGEDCPAELLATGPERHGWRIAVKTPHGPEVYGVLIAPAGDQWRARVLTYPRILWTIPGGGQSIKFLGPDPGAAEQKAIHFVRQHCRQKGFKKVEVQPVVRAGAVDPEEDARVTDEEAQRRKPEQVPVRYGVGQLSGKAVTADLSEGGAFIVTRSPLEPGTRIRLQIELQDVKIPMRGVVRWKRQRSEPGRPYGMGVELTRPHRLYVQYVRKLS